MKLCHEIEKFNIAVKEAKVSHADEIDKIQMEINRNLGGDASIAEIVALMVTRGWQRPKITGDKHRLRLSHSSL